jgi:uncharacterized protein YyaL (SSP411 family)
MMLTALEEQLQPPQVVILRGRADEVGAWSKALAPLYAPRRMLFAIPADAAGLPEALASKVCRGKAVAYVCEGPQCSEPIDDLPRLVQLLRDGVLTASR